MQLLSVNVGKGRVVQVGNREVETGIHKLPVVERVPVGLLGLQGDTIVDTRHHGGADQALYMYSAQDYAWWEQELGRPLAFGLFGENLTFSEFGGCVHIGDRFCVGSVVLEATAPRIPCAVFAARMDDPKFVKRFRNARRPGFYARVIEPGHVGIGDSIRKISSGNAYLTLDEMFELHYQKPSQEALARLLEAPISERNREYYAGLLE